MALCRLRRYEISNWARPSEVCRHNIYVLAEPPLLGRHCRSGPAHGRFALPLGEQCLLPDDTSSAWRRRASRPEGEGDAASGAESNRPARRLI